ncbi:MAG: ABC transporter ATP-binding protein [Clostridiales bacterium]|nr:ABC transporter ATP-binding protein [Clostridiales bacterium]
MLEVTNLTKKYSRELALDNVSLSFQKGVITGILGPNGSGKTTFMRIISRTLKGYVGDIKLFDKQITDKSKEFISFLPENNHLYDWMSIGKVVKFYVDFFSDFDIDDFKKLSMSLGLNDKTLIRALPKGVLQQFRVCLVLSRKASIYLLDEPLSNIDVLAREKIIEMIRMTTKEENCIIITSHLISEIELLLDNVCFLKEGKLIFRGSCDAIRDEDSTSILNKYKEVMTNEEISQI